MKDRGFRWLFVVYVLLFLADVGFTLANSAHLSVLEVNPVFRWCGSLWPIIVLNLVVLWLLWWSYSRRKAGPFSRYLLISLMFTVCVARLVAVRNAWHWLRMDPGVRVVALERVSREVVVSSQVSYAWLLYVPVFLLVLVYWVFQYDHSIKRRDLE